jgi:hypothetical protein
MSTVDNLSTFSFSCVFDLVEFYETAIMLLATWMKCYGCGRMIAVVISASFS